MYIGKKPEVFMETIKVEFDTYTFEELDPKI